MNNNGKTPLLDIKYNVEYPVEILGYKEGENKYGLWHFYQLDHNGEKVGCFAQPNLHQKLSGFRDGDVVTIQKVQTSRDGYDWVVNGDSDHQPDPPKTPTPVASKPPQSSVFDDRTHDIHRQVCLKVAVKSFPASDRPWNDEVVAELKRRTDSLMVVLEGVSHAKDDDNLPF